MTPIDQLWRLDGRVTVVTGAARGFGAAIARRLAEAGAAVTVADIRPDDARLTAERITAETGMVCDAHAVDVSDEASVSALFAAVESSKGPVDVLINNAGVFSNYYVSDMPHAEFARIMDINVTGTFLCSREAARSMRPRGAGVIVNVASVDAHAPSAVSSGSDHGIDLEAQWDGIVQRTPLGRLCRPDDIGRAVVYLASDMAEFVTGVLLPIDGGILVQPLEGYVSSGVSG
jgi:NAD(P)-dependent dehydrogenase (short-subunit alcohol dehydrogenase family)